MSTLASWWFNRLRGVATNVLMSDILYLQVKEHAGKLRSNEAGQAANTTGDLGKLTATGSHDMYLAKAHASASLNGTDNHQGNGTIVLKVNGTVKETWNFTLVITSGEGSTSTADHEFLTGFKVTTGQIIKLECTVSGLSTVTEGAIECTEELTGESPFQASEFQ